MVEGITLIIIVVVLLIAKNFGEVIHDNRSCPPGKEIDYKKANHDLYVDGISKQEYFRRYNKGYYDKDKK